MPRLRSRLTGVVVDVDDATAALVGAQYEPVTEPPAPEPKRRAPTKKK